MYDTFPPLNEATLRILPWSPPPYTSCGSRIFCRSRNPHPNRVPGKRWVPGALDGPGGSFLRDCLRPCCSEVGVHFVPQNLPENCPLSSSSRAAFICQKAAPPPPSLCSCSHLPVRHLIDVGYLCLHSAELPLLSACTPGVPPRQSVPAAVGVAGARRRAFPDDDVGAGGGEAAGQVSAPVSAIAGRGRLHFLG